MTAISASGCGGEGCASVDPWPLHHVRHRGLISRLCTSCVLRSHISSFCSQCFYLLPLDQSPPPPLLHCSNCQAVAHLSCLAESTDDYLCRSCSNGGGFPYFPHGDARRQPIDVSSTKALLAAARLTAASMRRAAVAARAEAERKIKEAALARKRAREMIEITIYISKKEESADSRVVVAADPKKKKSSRGTPKMLLSHDGEEKKNVTSELY